MNPISQKLLGIGAVIGFTATFLAGSPEVNDVLGLVVRSLLGGIIFGVLGYFIGLMIHRFLSEKLEAQVESFLLERELKRQKRVEAMKAAASARDEMELESLTPAEPVDTESGTVEGTFGEASVT